MSNWILDAQYVTENGHTVKFVTIARVPGTERIIGFGFTAAGVPCHFDEDGVGAVNGATDRITGPAESPPEPITEPGSERSIDPIEPPEPERSPEDR